MHRQRASMGCRHSAPVDPIDAPTDAIRPKLLPPSRHGSVIPTARDPLASIGQQSKLPRRSSLSSVGRLGRAAGAPQSRTEFDAALTAKLERLALSRGTEGSGEADASEAVVEMTTPDRGDKSQSKRPSAPRGGRRGDGSRRRRGLGASRGRLPRITFGRRGRRGIRPNAAQRRGDRLGPRGRLGGRQGQEQERRRRLRKPPIDADVPFSRTRTRAASLGRRDPIEPVPVSRRTATAESRVSSSSASASAKPAPTYSKPTIASRHAAASDSDPIVVTKHFVWDPERGLRRRARVRGRNARSNARRDVFFRPNVDAADAADGLRRRHRADSPRRVVAPRLEDAVPARQAVRAEDTREETERRRDARQEERCGDAAQAPARSHLYRDVLTRRGRASGSDVCVLLDVSIEIRVRSKLRRQPPRARRGALR